MPNTGFDHEKMFTQLFPKEDDMIVPAYQVAGVLGCWERYQHEPVASGKQMDYVIYPGISHQTEALLIAAEEMRSEEEEFKFVFRRFDIRDNIHAMRVDIGNKGNLYDMFEDLKGFIVQNERYRIDCVCCADFVLDQVALNITARFMLEHIAF